MPFQLKVDVLDDAGAEHLRQAIRGNKDHTPTSYDKGDGKHVTLTFDQEAAAASLHKTLSAEKGHLNCHPVIKI